MQFDAWDKLFNLVLLVLWFAMWHGEERRMIFNPYLAPLAFWNTKLSNYLKPVVFNLNNRAIAGIAFCIVLLLRALVAMSGAKWVLIMGFFAGEAAMPNVLSYVLFSALSFSIFLFQVWGICMIYVHSHKPVAFSNTAEALHEVSRPFSDLRIDLRPPALLAFGVVVAYLLTVVGSPIGPGNSVWLPSGPLFPSLVRSFISALAAWTGVLPIIRSLLILLIIGSWVSMFTQSQGLMLLCRDWLDFIMGPLRRYPLQIGPVDLTPIVMIFALDFLHKFLMSILLSSYQKLL